MPGGCRELMIYTTVLMLSGLYVPNVVVVLATDLPLAQVVDIWSTANNIIIHQQCNCLYMYELNSDLDMF